MSTLTAIAAYVFVLFVAVVGAFQVALCAGMPWGSLAMGGKFPGKFPPYMRGLALIQLAVLAFFGMAVLARADIAFSQWAEISRKLVWGVVFFSAVSVLANLATPSKWERILWAPVAIIMLACSLVVAFD